MKLMGASEMHMKPLNDCLYLLIATTHTSFQPTHKYMLSDDVQGKYYKPEPNVHVFQFRV